MISEKLLKQDFRVSHQDLRYVNTLNKPIKQENMSLKSAGRV